jgi:hypothetical protein
VIGYASFVLTQRRQERKRIKATLRLCVTFMDPCDRLRQPGNAYTTGLYYEGYVDLYLEILRRETERQ